MKNIVLALGLIASPAYAGMTEVVDVKASNTGDMWRFDVTVRHADTGWDHYADGWGIYSTDGAELGFRKLLHPHVSEQPFTRSLSGVSIPTHITEIIIRAHDSEHGWGEDIILELDNLK